MMEIVFVQELATRCVEKQTVAVSTLRILTESTTINAFKKLKVTIVSITPFIETLEVRASPTKTLESRIAIETCQIKEMDLIPKCIMAEIVLQSSVRVQSTIGMGRLSVVNQFFLKPEISTVLVELALLQSGFPAGHYVHYLIFSLESLLVFEHVRQEFGVCLPGCTASICDIVDSNVFRRNSVVQFAVPHANVQRTIVNRSPMCQSHSIKLSIRRYACFQNWSGKSMYQIGYQVQSNRINLQQHLIFHFCPNLSLAWALLREEFYVLSSYELRIRCWYNQLRP
ncbi:MAG: hypothetical protein EZS28_024282 [Streblomastix strix]|uniref:Uncharacterized protein n=1 Tax=Streblomastix strix TaxID=222440 RepID=A0A5J4VCJ1_9EUKA|nr:MAG: hypothetical protein EZS28_024282 [Streblomastix strix]